MGNRVYVQNPPAQAQTQQERVMCFDADTGKVLWEYRFNIFQSDVPPHRVGWASPAADPETGNIYVFGVGGTLLRAHQGRQAALGALARRRVRRVHDARRPHDVADRRRQSGHRQRRHLELGHAGQPRRIRFVALDKRTGDIVWVSTPGGRPYDTAYAQPDHRHASTACGCSSPACGDGGVHAIKPQTGEKVWSF